jgi:hypothetical protein
MHSMMTIPHRTLRKEVNELKEMLSKGLLRKLLESEGYKAAIVRSFKQIDEATKTFLVCIYILSGYRFTHPSHLA